MMVFQMYNDTIHFTVDVFVRYPLDFEELWSMATQIEVPGSKLRIASIDHLILMKREAARPQDLADIEMLNKLKQLIAEQEKASK
jgi:predicted nucleotidyltransferase